jgi:hypothetical protein
VTLLRGPLERIRCQDAELADHALAAQQALVISIVRWSSPPDLTQLARTARFVSRVTGLMREAARRGYVDPDTLGGTLPALQATADRVMDPFLGQLAAKEEAR